MQTQAPLMNGLCKGIFQKKPKRWGLCPGCAQVFSSDKAQGQKFSHGGLALPWLGSVPTLPPQLHKEGGPPGHRNTCMEKCCTQVVLLRMQMSPYLNKHVPLEVVVAVCSTEGSLLSLRSFLFALGSFVCFYILYCVGTRENKCLQGYLSHGGRFTCVSPPLQLGHRRLRLKPCTKRVQNLFTENVQVNTGVHRGHRTHSWLLWNVNASCHLCRLQEWISGASTVWWHSRVSHHAQCQHLTMESWLLGFPPSTLLACLGRQREFKDLGPCTPVGD